MRLPYIDLTRYELYSGHTNIIPKRLSHKYKLLALDKLDNILVVAVPYKPEYKPTEINKLRELLCEKLNHVVQFVSCKEKDIVQYI